MKEVGRAHRQGRRVDLSAGTALAGVAEDQAAQGAGVRRRRLDRAAADAAALRRAAARRPRGRRAEVRRPHRHRIRSERARARVEAPEGARDEDVAVLGADQDATSPPTGPARTSSRRSASPSGRPTASSAIRSISGCGMTRSATEVGTRRALPARVPKPGRKDLDGVIEQLRALEDARKDGELTLPNGDRLKVTNLAKLFWPRAEDHERRSAPLLRRGVPVHPSRASRIGRW